jgi:prolyl oligopeptidase
MRFIQLLLLCFTASAAFAGDHHRLESTTEGKEARMAKDEYSLLEDADDSRTRAWLKIQHDRTAAALKDARFRSFSDLALQAAQGFNRFEALAVPGAVPLRDGWIYQHWSDQQHPKGIWRRARFDAFVRGEPRWDVLLDVDALSARENKSWMFLEAVFSPRAKRALIRLSDGGSNVNEWREFSVDTREFVAGGFIVPAALAAYADWRDENTLLVSADFGQGTLSAAGEPLVVKQWVRGQSLRDAPEIFRAPPDAASAEIYLHENELSAHGPRSITILTRDERLSHTWWQIDERGRAMRMTLPSQIGSFASMAGHYVFHSKADWSIGGKTWRAGDLLAIAKPEIRRSEPTVRLVLAAGEDESIQFVTRARNGLLVHGVALGASVLWAVKPSSGWSTARIAMPANGSIVPGMVDDRGTNVFVLYQTYLRPPTLYRIDVGVGKATVIGDEVAPQFDASALVTEQWQAKSADGALVPYFITYREDLRFDGETPTVVHGYGAAGGSLSPRYSATLGKLWLERGGAYVDANVRGGAERGEKWHVTGVHRERTYEDMLAVVDDLIRRKVTRPKRVGVMGQSAGGLLAAVMLNRRPDLFGAAVLRVPLLDQFRMDLAMGTPGSSYAEFGSPEEPEGLAFLQRTSPFQNLRQRADFPAPLIITAANDQNVFPAQARRYAAKLDRLGLPFYFYEAAEGGHAAAASRIEQARLDALIFSYLDLQLASSR